MNKKLNALVVGGAGFIGSNLTDRLVELGNKVTVLDNLSTGKKEFINKQAKFVKADIRELKKIRPYFKGHDIVFLLAAKARIQPSIIDPVPTFDNNVTGTLNVLIAARDAGVKRLVYSASSSSYGDQKIYPAHEDMRPNFKNPYALSKYIGEELCRVFSLLYGLETVSLRYFNVYGSRQATKGAYATVIGIFLSQLRSNRPLTIVGDGKAKRDFTNVSDVVNANILAAQSSKVGRGELINIGTGNNYSINDVAASILLLKKSYQNMDLKSALQKALKNNEAIYIPSRPGENKQSLADNKKAKKLLGWQPHISLAEGLDRLTQAKRDQ